MLFDNMLLEGNDCLSFEDFRVYQKNFRGFFAGGFAGDNYRNSPIYMQCLAVKSVELGALSEKLRKLNDDHSLDYQVLLYEAYLLMHPFATKNWDLFQ